MSRPFHQLDVFTKTPLQGNPLAVVHDAGDVRADVMQTFARWTNLSETTFLMPPVDPRADYRVRIFTPGGELPFAGHPTLGGCHAWLAAGGRPKQTGVIVQECEVGLVPIRQEGARLAFAAPPLRRTGPLEPELVTRIARGLGVEAAAIRHHQWVDNGPGWCAVMLPSAADVLAVRPDFTVLSDLKLGLVGPHSADHDAAFEVRGFVPSLGIPEDPVTGSLHAGLGQWLIGAGLAPERYIAAQGTALGRAGRVHITRDGADVWVGGDVVTCIEGHVHLP